MTVDTIRGLKPFQRSMENKLNIIWDKSSNCEYSLILQETFTWAMIQQKYKNVTLTNWVLETDTNTNNPIFLAICKT